jgi:hypothetical protein
VTSDNGYINMGGPHEATDYVAGCGPALHGTPGAVEWLTNQNSCCPAAKTTVSCPLIPVSRAMTPSIERRCLVDHAPWSGWSIGAREREVRAFGRASDRSSGPLVLLSRGAPSYISTLKRQRSRLSRECFTAAHGVSSRSIRSNRRRAARERWSSSLLGTLLLDRLVLITAPSKARTPAKIGDRTTNSSPIPRRCVSRFTYRRFI